ncbi:uncharacterized protein FA14DRAFT_155651 [Meira miltonrushii]|uniref:Rho-GAP domain-containing protein n=1 Tax=Meira miltonrushii TaxID=1280837 RepID=A0A316VFF7_9BASI|nr:uncharacterized protein FA14DRAFT_155651 [Meira miltonrushii]PWN36246.1 hypothetical protein FA14DRAFT_155651 [Meira miltonrushii]
MTTESRIPSRAEKSPLQSKFQRHQNDAEVGRPSSRLSSFSPFRRSTHFSTPSQHIQNSPTPSFSSGWSSNQNSIGGIGEAPQATNRSQSSSSSSKIPFKPPKPAALRVKKAKALSISLLGGGGGNNNPEETNNRLYRPQSSLAMRDTPKTAIGISNDRSTEMTPMTLQEALAADDGGDRYPSMPGRTRNKRELPPRSSSALDFYRANGPSKGLSNREFPSPRNEYQPSAFENAQEGEQSDEDHLFIIGANTSSPSMHQRKRSASFSSNTALETDIALRSAPLPQSPQGWPLDTARELLSASSKGPLSSPPVHTRNGIDEFKVYGSQVTHSNLPLRSNGSGLTASPFLNTFNARAQMQPATSPISSNSSPQSRIPRRKAAPAPLGKADILRSIQGASSDSSNPSSPLSTYGNLPSSPRRTPSHKRIPSSSEINDSTKHFQLPRQRNRSQSHVFGAAELGSLNADLSRLDSSSDLSLGKTRSLASESVLPQHPLSARGEPYSGRHMLSEGPVVSARTTSKTSNIIPPPLRKNRLTKLGTQESQEQSLPPSGRMHDERYRLPGMANGSSTGNQATSLQGWGQQIGGMGAAVGKKGWDMFKQWNASANNNNNNISSVPTQSSKVNHSSRMSISTNNEATRKWIAALEGPQSVGKAGGQSMRSGVFGVPLHDAVLYTRLGSTDKSRIQSPGRAQITALDLGSEFKIDLPGLKTPSPIDTYKKQEFFERRAVDRGEARLRYLPGLVVRCIEAIESFGIDEEGIYRLSGRSTHTTKLRQIFDAPLPKSIGAQKAADLRLADIGPADLDLNSVCSLLKSYLRELPDNLIPEEQAAEMNANVAKQCGIQAVGPPLLPGVPNPNGIGKGELEQAMAIKVAASGANSSPQDQANMGGKIANAILGTMSQLPAANWYLLRELSMHLADLTRPEVIERTRMPLSNLCLVLAPTLALSVPLMRAMVEECDTVFGQSCPAMDPDLDNADAKLSRSTDSNVTNRYIPPANNLGLRLPTEPSNRMSTATVTDKRKSTSSVMTLQAVKTPKASKNATNGESYLSLEKAPVQSLMEEDDPDLFTSPIAAQFIRQRKASIAGSLDCLSLNSEGSLGSGPKARVHPSLLQDNASDSGRANPNMSHSSSLAPSPLIPQAGTDTFLSDRDSIHSSGPSDDYSSAASSLGASTSSGSIHGSSPLLTQTDRLRSSSSNGSISALDRPRPKTGSTAKFFSAMPKTRTNAAPHSRVASNASAGTVSIQSFANSTNSNGSNEGPATPVAQKRDFIEAPPLINVNSISSENEDAGTKTVRASPEQKKFVDDSPMDMQAIRRYWSKQM